MRIYRIANNKEAKISDLFTPSSIKLEGIAKSFIQSYFDRTKRLPTVGEILLKMMDSERGESQESLRGVVVSALSSFRNSLQEV